MGREDDELIDELGFNDVRNEGEHYEDAGYRRKNNSTHTGTSVRDNKMQKQSVPHQLTWSQIEILVDTVVKNHPKEVQQYRSKAQKDLIVYYLAGVAMGICKHRAEPNMLNVVLREKLDKATFVATKGNVQQEGKGN